MTSEDGGVEETVLAEDVHRLVLHRGTGEDQLVKLRRDSFAELDGGGTITATTVLTKLLRLQQFTGGFLVEDGASRSRYCTICLRLNPPITQYRPRKA